MECERQPVRFYRWADKIKQWRDQYAPGKPIWLGETGNAQFGGEPGLSDAYLGGLWWLDELGLLARKDHAVVVRQTLECFFYMATHHPLTPQTILSIFAPNS